MRVKIKIIGKDGQGWSIDKDRFYNEKVLSELDYNLTKCLIKADIIYAVWYSYLLKKKLLPLKILKGKRKVVAAVTNNIEKVNTNFSKYKNYVDYWICANSEQKEYLLKQEVEAKNIFFNPFYVDEFKFKNIRSSKKEIASKLNIDYKQIENKFIIGSFQRDSRGDDLTKSKWHKNPEQIINILKKIDKNKILLLLAGPRRHFLINECRKNKIPYLFIGNEKYVNRIKDDISENNLSQDKINLLYNLIDLYIVTSVSEGGPKAIIEASLTKTAILSTPVGFAPNLLDEYLICSNENDFFNKITEFIEEEKILKDKVQINYDKVSQINNFEAYKQRLKKIFETISNDR